MNHSEEFMILLKHIYMLATEKEVFAPGPDNQIKSRHEWERLIHETGGFVD